MRNSVFRRDDASWSFASLFDSKESISSMKIIDGRFLYARSNKAFTFFSPSPMNFETIDDALMLKNVAFDSPASAFATIVLPVPGGPKSNNPFGGFRRPLKISGFSLGSITASVRAFFTESSPTTSSKSTPVSCLRICSSNLFSAAFSSWLFELCWFPCDICFNVSALTRNFSICSSSCCCFLAFGSNFFASMNARIPAL
mmetsp:Transcript_8905/g.14447  ORF Transcript_8905/g.14447 Transcript_8905/m.14447 type:complete len:200 (+) Transcript_8905:153-752(+)